MNMESRINKLGGKFILKTSPGKGTRVDIEIVTSPNHD